MAPLTPVEADALVQLRALLIHAQRVSRVSSRATRLVAVILLDAVNERATHLAATTLGVEVSAKAGLEELFAKVKQHLGSSWQAAAWPDIRRLHRVRNNAQHEGAGADRDEIAGWRAATERYTRELVHAVSDVDIDRVMLGEAIDNPDVRKALIAAEDSLRRGDAPGSIAETKRAFTTALDLWRKAHRARRPSNLLLTPSDPQAMAEIGDLRDTVQNQVFATGPAEYLWFVEIVAADPRTVNLGEAERALAFAFWWLVGWQAAAPSFEGDRQSRWIEASRKVRLGLGPARIATFRVEHRQFRTKAAGVSDPANGLKEEWIIEFVVEDVPPPDLFGEWREIVRKQITGRGTVGYAMVDDLGNIRCSVPGEREDAVEAVTADVANSLAGAEAEMIRVGVATQQERSEREQAETAFATRFKARREEFPPWILDARRSSDWRGPTMNLDVLPEAEAMVRSKLSNVDGLSCVSARDGGLALAPPPSIDSLVTLLASMDGVVRATLDEASRSRARLEKRQAEIEARIRRALVL